MNASQDKVLVWDLPVRVGHWLMAGCFVLAWLTGESEEGRLVHVFAGGAMVGIALFRVIWGLVGSRYALFVDFLRGPQEALSYLKNLLGPEPEHYLGHNPAGGYAIVLLLGLGLLSGASGWLTYQEMGGEWLADLHELAVHAMLIVVLVHLCGVFIGSVAHRENLVRPMFTGYKSGDPTDRIASARPVAALLLLAWIASAAWLLSR
jgi:cytochrome b